MALEENNESTSSSINFSIAFVISFFLRIGDVVCRNTTKSGISLTVSRKWFNASSAGEKSPLIDFGLAIICAPHLRAIFAIFLLSVETKVLNLVNYN